MDIKISREIDKSNICVEMVNTQGFDMKYPLGFISPSGFIRFQTTDVSADGTPRYSFASESSSYSISLFGEEYGGASSCDYKEWIPLNTEKEVLLALEIQKAANAESKRRQTKMPNAVKILNDFVPESTWNLLNSTIKLEVIAAMNNAAREAIELNK